MAAGRACFPHRTAPQLFRRTDIGLDSSGAAVPYTTFTLPALAWDISYVALPEPIPDLNPEAVGDYLSKTDQVTPARPRTCDTSHLHLPTAPAVCVVARSAIAARLQQQ